MLYKMTDSELRSLCKEKTEALEYWLRRIIDETLTADYGDYLNYSDGIGNRVIKSTLAKQISDRQALEPHRYQRYVDAILLDDAINIICNPNLYKKHFRDAFSIAFPLGSEEAKQFMQRLINPRNALSHANPISIRQAEQVICYSNDIIDSLKQFYIEKNMANEYNVPLILKVTDSFGNVFHRDQLNNVHDGGISRSFLTEPQYYLRVGDTLTLEVEVDPSFDPSEYSITWGSAKGFSEAQPPGSRLVMKVTEKQVAQQFDVQCRVTSNKDWHRMHLGADDFLLFYYKVLPPV